jgi:hypothetical protein
MRSNLGFLTALIGVPAVLSAQVPQPANAEDHWLRGRVAVDAVYSHTWVQRPFPENWTSSHAIGGRLTWRLANPSIEPASSLSKLAVGAHVSFTPEHQLDFGNYRLANVAGVVDYFPLGSDHRVEPVLSFAAGALRAEVDDQRLPSSIMTMPEGTRTQFAVTPAAGVRVRILNRLGIRGEYRDTFVRYRRWWHMPELATGASLLF